MIKIPPYLEKGNTIGIVCPAGSMPLSRIEHCIKQLRVWGFKVKCGQTLGKRNCYFSGTDTERLSDFQQMLNDTEVRAILCARGGYGVSRMIDQVDFSAFKKKPKWLIGYSDITVLHAHVYKNFKTATLHAPMAGAFNDIKGEKFVLTLHEAITGKKASYHFPSTTQNRKGIAEGPLIGGNLSILNNLIGTSSDMDFKNKILFIEDIDEYLYHIDRMLVQLKRSNRLAQLVGLIVGSFTGMKDTKLPFGKTVEEIIFEHVGEYDYPVCFQFPVGHTYENLALKYGVTHSLLVKNHSTTLTET